jgi:hypothetical protein
MTASAALPVTRRVLRIFITVNYLAGSLALALFIASVMTPQELMQAINIKPADATGALLLDMRIIIVIGLASVPLMIVVLKRLLEIVDTVGAGNPFVGRNAQRLTTIGWMLLALNVLDLAVGFIVRGKAPGIKALDASWDFSFTPWLAVLLSFVLARVFEHGARMREELEGTV